MKLYFSFLDSLIFVVVYNICYKFLVLLPCCQRGYGLYNFCILEFIDIFLGPNKLFVLISIPRKLQNKVYSLKGTKFICINLILLIIISWIFHFYLLESLKNKESMFSPTTIVFVCISCVSNSFCFMCFQYDVICQIIFLYLREKIFSFKDLYTFVNFT